MHHVLQESVLEVDGAREVYALACPDTENLSVPDAATLWHIVNAVHCSVPTIKFLTGKLVQVCALSHRIGLRLGLGARLRSPAPPSPLSCVVIEHRA